MGIMDLNKGIMDHALFFPPLDDDAFFLRTNSGDELSCLNGSNIWRGLGGAGWVRRGCGDFTDGWPIVDGGDEGDTDMEAFGKC